MFSIDKYEGPSKILSKCEHSSCVICDICEEEVTDLKTLGNKAFLGVRDTPISPHVTGLGEE